MKAYKLKGLSCPNCASDLEKEIQKIKHGENAKISYNKAQLTINEKVDLEKVRGILSSDGASIVVEDDGEHDHTHGSLLKWYLIVSAIIFFMAIFLENAIERPFLIISMYVAAMALSGYTTFFKGVKNLSRLKFNIDTLMTIALIGAVSIGEWKEGTLVAILFGLNEYLEGLGMEKARHSMEKLLEVAPKEAIRIENGVEQVIPIDALKVGDLVLIKSGETIPSDGIVIEGRSSVNEAAITGESLPVDKEIGESVFGGSLNNEGVLKVEITRAYEDSSLAKVLHLVEEAQETKTPTELFINRFAKYYTPFIIVFAGLVMVVPPLFFNASWGEWFYQGLAVLIVGCPCALILSSPIANISGITRNARNGILVKGSVFLEWLGKIDTIVFDKTGTLTKGEPHVEKMIEYDKSRFLPVAAAIEKSSSHPLAKAIMKKAEGISTLLKEPEEIRTVSGQGVEAVIDGEKYWLGNEESIGHLSVPNDIQADIQRLKEEGLTIVLVADQKSILGCFGIEDEIRSESKTVIQALKKAGIKRTVMLTGDHQQTARKVANQIGLTDVYSNLLPEDKVEKVKMLAKDGKVAMVGDGINDAPALATADIGIAMGKGTDSAIETADIVLMQDHLGKLPNAIRVAKMVNRLIKVNIAIALGLKAIALLLTIPGMLTLWIAILSDMGATIIVTILSLTVLIERKNKNGQKAGELVHE
ncbi:cadmium-translocating P-type ATPase [Pueribacillus theae]|uniref:Cd(2+)-exporting ATPase n=1 Tax=Pueribacillus theae TaxID=2171751 RepID=A0A2U1K893_9BACI|nr:heavy metal translocating P-type ATPase [Pueribacillus theae]PWA13228.1 cadmium-translocating P-type ATPase [Pueribacillus theae]